MPRRMLAVIAASGLALGSLPGVAQAQSVEIGLGVGAVVGSAALGAGLGLDAGSSGGDAPDLGSLTDGGSLDSDALDTDWLGVAAGSGDGSGCGGGPDPEASAAPTAGVGF